MRQKLLGVAIDEVTLDQASDQISRWIGLNKQEYIVTPNVEMIMASQKDKIFKEVLNNAGLAIPDSARLGWALNIQAQSSLIFRLLKWPFFLFPSLSSGKNFPVTTGTDLMEKLLQSSETKGFRVGLLGGEKNVAIKLTDCLLKKYPKLMIQFVQENLNVDLDGNHTFFQMENVIGFKQNQIISSSREDDFYQNLNSCQLDLLFVAFGHTKQEKWMNKNLRKTNVKVMLGVGGAFDYLSGQVRRAPKWVRASGMEWLYRLILQPWRIMRFGSLVAFVFAVLFTKDEKAFADR